MIPIGVGRTTTVRVANNHPVRLVGITFALPAFFPERISSLIFTTKDGLNKDSLLNFI